MTPERWQQIDRLLEAALEREPSQRADFLDEVCAGDEALRREIETLLTAQEQAGSFIEAPPAEMAAELLNQADSMIGQRIGPELGARYNVAPTARWMATREMSLLMELIGKTLDGKYRIERLLGQGGMGAVYFATHLGTTRPVALKIIAPQYMAHEEFVARFKREAEAAGRLLHPHIVNVTDFGFAAIEEQQVAYMVMEFLDGSTLGELLDRYGRLPLRVVVDLVEQICLAIDAAHRQGIIHRDLKPDNIWLQPDGRGGYVVKVLDFGLAKLRDPSLSGAVCATDTKAKESTRTLSDDSVANRSSIATQIIAKSIEDETPTEIAVVERATGTQISPGEITRVGAILGTPLYMSPEQCAGEPLDARADIYSLGVIVFQMLAGTPPFSGNLSQLITQHSSAPAPALAARRRDIPASVAQLVASALAKLPAQRPASAAAFASALRANADRAGMLLHQAITLYSEHFRVFVSIALMPYIPFLVIIGLHLMNEVQAMHAILPAIISENAKYFLRMLMILGGLVAITINSGIFVPVVAQLQIAPLRPLSPRAVFAEFKLRLRALAITSLLFNLAIFPLVLFFIMMIYRVWLMPNRSSLLLPLLIVLAIAGMKLIQDYMLYPSVVILEDQQGIVALMRAKVLARRVRRVIIMINLPLVIFAIINIFLAFGVLAGNEVNNETVIGNRIFSTHLYVYDSALAALITIVGIVANPVFAIVLALLYIKARQAGGDTLDAVLGKFAQETTHE